MSQANLNTVEDHVVLRNAAGSSSIVLVCEHASHYIPAEFDSLGLSEAALKSHVAWDPGAMALAEHMARHLDAPLVASGVSRLVYDCNRAPNAADAMPERSEIIDVPGNRNLSQSHRDARTDAYYRPFHAALKQNIGRVTGPIIVTIHSFTPRYHGELRSVEIGILHDSDPRLADAMLEVAQTYTGGVVRRNEPYGPQHGVTHTLKEHAISGGHLNVMLEIRNDLIETPDTQTEMAETLSKWIAGVCAHLDVAGTVQCQV